MSGEDAAVGRIRRGLGLIIILAGVIHVFEMTLAVLYTIRRLPIVITGRLWSEMYFAHFLFLVMGSLLYLTFSYKRSGVFYFETLVDFLISIPGFIVLLTVSAALLARSLVAPWWAFAPSVWLLGYGFFLRTGRSVFVRRPAASARP